MVKISSVEFQKNFGRYQDTALTEAVTVTRNGRDRIVLLSVAEYQRLKRRDRQVLSIEDFTEADIAAIKKTKAVAEAFQFDHEIE